jgi:hypothetical protein
MRTISTELYNAQFYDVTRKAGRIPYVSLIFHNKDNSDIKDYSDRRLGIEHHENNLGGDYATIKLNNRDHLVEDINGWWVNIVYGDYFIDVTNHFRTITGQEGRATGRLWVKSFIDYSAAGKKYVVLELADKQLEEKPCLIPQENMVAPYHYVKWTDRTPFWIMAVCLNSAGFGMGALGVNDGFINTFISNAFYINYNNYKNHTGTYETFKDVIEHALSYTKCYLRKEWEADPDWNERYEVVYPQESDPVDEIYYSSQQPYFTEFYYRKNVVIPNHILTYCNYDDDLGEFSDPLLIGSAVDQDSSDSYDDVIDLVWCKDITLQADADFAAQSILERKITASKGGRIIVPHDIRVELWDKVEVQDSR